MIASRKRSRAASAIVRWRTAAPGWTGTGLSTDAEREPHLIRCQTRDTIPVSRVLSESDRLPLFSVSQVSTHQRLGAFVLSGALAGFAGGLYVHLLPLNAGALYLDLTFVTLAMLVIGGASSLWGAVVGALAVSALDSFLAEAENGVKILGGTLDLPSGTRVIVEGILMTLVLIARPSGLTGGREFALPRLPRRAQGPAPPSSRGAT